MLNLCSLKFCFAASLFVHAVVFGVVKWAGMNHRPAALQQDREVMTLQLVAAPIAPAEAVVAPTALPLTPTSPEPEPVTPPPPPVVEPPPPVVEKTETVPLLPEPERVPEPVPVEPPPVPVPTPMTKAEAQVASTTITVPARGDGSSIRPGEDATTSQVQPGVLARPNYLKNPEPTYPLQARRRQQQGAVLIEVKVSAKGRALEVSVKESSGYAILDEAAVNAVRDWEFEPARVGMTAVESRIEVPVRFRLAQ